MEEQGAAVEGQEGSGSGGSTTTTTTEPVRSRWTPKPEQILILESIFNSGMVNPPKEETVRIRKLLEKFGSVGDANVFYWFQNRRSRSRRRQRQMQAAAASASSSATTLQPSQLIMPPSQLPQPQLGLGGGVGAIIHPHHPYEFDGTNNTSYHQPHHYDPNNNNNFSFLSSSSCGNNNNMDGMSTMMNPHQLDTTTLTFPQLQHHSPSPLLYPPSSSNFNFHSPGLVTVFINGVATEVPRGPIDIKTMFGQDVVLVHSSGVPLPTNEFGCLMQTLQHGESYFLVSKPT